MQRAYVTEVAKQGKVKEWQVLVVVPAEPNVGPNLFFFHSLDLFLNITHSQDVLWYLI